MPKDKEHGRNRSALETPTLTVHVTWHTTAAPTPTQAAAWRRLWRRLLDESRSEMTEPQDPVEPGAATFATFSGGHNLNKDTTNDSRIALHLTNQDRSCVVTRLGPRLAPLDCHAPR